MKSTRRPKNTYQGLGIPVPPSQRLTREQALSLAMSRLEKAGLLNKGVRF